MSVLERIRLERFVAVIRRVPDLDAAAAELLEHGVRVLEFTLDSPGALEAIARWRTQATVLAGTVRTAAEAEAAVAAGAHALVSPTFDPELVRTEHEVPFIPGCFTPSEVERAWRSGAELVKLFPAGALGAAYVRSLLAPLADVPLVVTGGITAENALDFLAAGAVAVGADSSRAAAVWERVRVGT
jgi:2-dehydro-3-deoxyphosphogluconate aldolase / (4S)-4-hydroxy-2-oxoglutarate aldolase